MSRSGSRPKAVTILPALPVTAVGKPYKVPLRCHAAREELTALLHALGVDLPTDDAWCVEIDGRLTVTLAVPDEALATAVAGLLDNYTVAHRISVAISTSSQ
jgi:fatty-acyl-CoA synthase